MSVHWIGWKAVVTPEWTDFVFLYRGSSFRILYLGPIAINWYVSPASGS